MKIYDRDEMIRAEHIKEIDKQLKKLGSKVDEKLLDGEAHILSNVLNLACSGGSYGLSLNKINSIGNNEFQLYYNCENSITGPKKQ